MSEKSGIQRWASGVLESRETAIASGERPPSGISVWLAEKIHKPENGYETFDGQYAEPTEGFFQKLSRQRSERQALSEQYANEYESMPKKNFIQVWLESRAAVKAERETYGGDNSYKDELKQAEKDRKDQEKADRAELAAQLKADKAVLKQAEKDRKAEEKDERERVKRGEY